MKRPIELPRLTAFASRDPSDETCRALGADHPLARVERRIVSARDQLAVCPGLAILGAALVAADRRLGVAILIAAVAIGAGYTLTLAALISVRRDRIHELFLQGTPPRLPAMVAEARRLEDPMHRSQLAAQLDRAVDEGLRWHEFTPASRPPYGVKDLPRHEQEIRDIAAGLRADTPSTRAIVLVERLIRGGYGSAIYHGDDNWLPQELARIRYELAVSASRSRQRTI